MWPQTVKLFKVDIRLQVFWSVLSVCPQSCSMSSRRVESVWTAGRCPLLCGGGTGRVITCVTPADSTTRWTGSTGRSLNHRDDWWVSLTFTITTVKILWELWNWYFSFVKSKYCPINIQFIKHKFIMLSTCYN